MFEKENLAAEGNGDEAQDHVSDENSTTTADSEATADALKPDYDASVEFLQMFRAGAASNEVVMVAILPDLRIVKPANFDPFEQPAKLREWIERMNGSGHNIYFTVGHARPGIRKKTAKQDMVAIDYVFVDLDPLKTRPLAEERTRLITLLETLQFSIVVDSGGGFQVYWRLEKAIELDGRKGAGTEAYERLLRTLCPALEGDPAATDCSRILRVPGTRNFPDAIKRAAGRKVSVARLVSTNNRRFRIEDLESIIGQHQHQRRHHGSDEKAAPPPEDQVVIERLLLDSDAAALFRGAWAECGYPSQSEADLALCRFITRHTTDRTQVDRIFRQSKLMRPKWDERHFGDGRTYGEGTLDKVFEDLASTETDEASEEPPEFDPTDTFEIPTVIVDDLIASAPEIVRDYVEWACTNGSYHNPAYALASALAWIGMATARGYYGPTNLSTNLYIAALGPTGCGKDQYVIAALRRMAAAADAALRHGLTTNGFNTRAIDSFASGQAVEAALAQLGGSIQLLLSELGKTLERARANGAPDFFRSFEELLLRLYGRDFDVVPRKIYAPTQGRRRVQQDEEPAPLHHPCLALIGGMTPEQVKSLNREALETGLLNRFIVIPSPQLKYRPLTVFVDPPPHLVTWMNRVHRGFLNLPRSGPALDVHVPWGPDAEECYRKLATQFANATWTESNPLHNRADMKILKIALCLALARDGEQAQAEAQLTVADLEWASEFLRRANDAAVRAILGLGGLVADKHQADMVQFCLQLRKVAESESGYIPVSRIFHNRCQRDRDELIRTAEGVGLIDLKSPQGDAVKSKWEIPRGTRVYPRSRQVAWYLQQARQ